jgi:hypothetical protein
VYKKVWKTEASLYKQQLLYIYIYILLKEIAASALMIFFDKDSILLTILLMVGGSSKIS